MLDYVVVIARIQPLHDGHVRLFRHALKKGRKLIVLIGSANQKPSPKNPFSWQTRDMFLRKSLDVPNGQLITRPIQDYPYNDTAWTTQVRSIVDEIVPPGSVVGLCGYEKDQSSSYQRWFPEWGYVSVTEQFGTFNATDIRNQYLQDSPIISSFMPEPVRHFLSNFVYDPDFKYLIDEKKYLDNYAKEWGNGPFITTDAVATQSGHILLVTRKEPPYRGSLALPGGFLNPRERIEDCVVRELKEETLIADDRGEIPAGALKKFIRGSRVFDDPNRSARGRIITHAYRFEFPDKQDLFKVQGADDAEFAQWYPLASLQMKDFMEDHGHIITEMTGVTLR